MIYTLVRQRWVVRTTLTFTALFLLIPVSAQQKPLEGLVSIKRDPQTITVGGKGADIPAFTSRAIQLAIDALRSWNGGTVQLGAGTYAVSSPIQIYSNISLIGAGSETVLKKSEGFRTEFVIDADYGMIKATVKDVSGFSVGRRWYRGCF